MTLTKIIEQNRQEFEELERQTKVCPFCEGVGGFPEMVEYGGQVTCTECHGECVVDVIPFSEVQKSFLTSSTIRLLKGVLEEMGEDEDYELNTPEMLLYAMRREESLSEGEKSHVRHLDNGMYIRNVEHTVRNQEKARLRSLIQTALDEIKK